MSRYAAHPLISSKVWRWRSNCQRRLQCDEARGVAPSIWPTRTTQPRSDLSMMRPSRPLWTLAS